ncbi:MAG: choice-of-anchor I family protein, partial [Planctomycetes bacterium]|nr:choice-of-anchor I family protein [Planctomycetota bacterium]
MRPILSIAAASALCVSLTAQIQLTKIGGYESGVFDEGAAEISAYDAGTQRLFVTNADANTLDVLSLADPTNPTLLFTVDLSPYGDGVNSVAVHDGVVAAAVEADPKTDPGSVVFLDVDGNFVRAITVGALPDMLTFSPGGHYLLVANEGEPNDDYTVDPEGSISVIRMNGGPLNATLRTADFGRFQNRRLDPSIRIFGPGATVAQDLEPEYIACGPFGIFAWAVCQENNALALIHLRTARVIGLYGLGFKNHNLPGNGLDPSNRDSGIEIANWPVYGMYQPDAIAVTNFFGIPFVLAATEGDARDYDGFSEEARIGDLTLDPSFPADIQDDDKLGRLTTTTVGGDLDNDGDKDVLFAFGARSLSIFTAFGDLVWDSGDTIEQVTATLLPNDFNSNNDENDSFDARSDDKGPEPEGVTVGQIGFHTYAFVCLERVGGVMVWDVTLPWAPIYVDYVTSRDFSGDAEAGTAGDLGPEGIVFIPAYESPNG